jgi:transcriptional regulator with XRE-family HTH domain
VRTDYKSIRRAAGLSQAAFGARAGVCFLTVLKFEKGRPVGDRARASMLSVYGSLTGKREIAEIRLHTSEEVRLAQEYVEGPILGRVVRLPVDSLLTRAFRDALLKHREDCGARRRGCNTHPRWHEME